MKRFMVLSLCMYSLSLVAQERFLLKDSLRKDLDLLYRMLDEVHPGTYRYLSEPKLMAPFESLYRDLPPKISEGDFLRKLAQTVSTVKCGHTYLNPWNMKSSIRARLFEGQRYVPFGFEIIDGRFYVTETVVEEGNIQRGAELLSLNGVPMQAVYDRLKTVPKRDGNNETANDFYFSLNEYGMRSYEAFDIYYTLFFPPAGAVVEVEYQNYNASIEKVTTSLLTKQERLDKITTKYGNESTQHKRWKLEIREKVAIMKIGTFAIWNWKDFNAKTWLKEAFQELEDRKVKRLMVDIRGNGGGDDGARNELLSYLIKEKVNMENTFRKLIRTTQVAEELHPYCDTWYKPVLTGLPADQFERFDEQYFLLTKKEKGTIIKPNKGAFGGDIYLFGDGSNTSATFQLFTLAQQYRFATVIGSESGGNRQGTNGSQYLFFYMPYSGMEVDIPLVFSQAVEEMPDAGVQPDIEVKNDQRSIALGEDPLIQYVLKKK